MKKILLISTIVALAAVSCTKGELDGQGAVPGQIQVSSTIAGAQSRGPLEGGAVLTDMRFLHGQLAAPVQTGAAVDLSGQTPFGGSRAADGAITFASGKEPMYDKLTGKHSYLLGYHPAGTAGANIVTWTPDGATDILISDAWYAGTYISPLDRGLTLSHALGCIEVQCEVSSASTLEQVRQSWGKIRGVLFKGTPKQLTLSYATNKVTPSSDRVDFPLLNGNTYIAGAFAPIDVPQANVVLASAMIAPTDANTFTLSVLSENRVSVDVLVTLATDVKFAAGQRHTVTLSFDAASGKIVASATTVNDWLPGENSVPPTLEPNAPGPVIEYGKGEFPLTGDVTSEPSYVTHNDKYGESAAATGGTNGPWYGDMGVVLTEPPYAKFEVASKELNTDKRIIWRKLQSTTLGGNICAQTFGYRWRLPRATELAVIYANQAKLELEKGFGPLANTYVSATEVNETVVWSVNSSRRIPGSKIVGLPVRCIKEVPPAIGDYYYSDKSFSTTYALPAGATLLGVIYRVNPDGTGMLVEVTDVSVGPFWSTVQETTGAISEESGVANTTTIKGLAGWKSKYPIFKYCEDKNTGGVTGWYLPAIKELQAFYAGFSGLRWVASGANTANGEVDGWGDFDPMPNNANYTAARTAFNAKMTAAGVGGTSFDTGSISRYWSSTENDVMHAVVVNFDTGESDVDRKNLPFGSGKSRCVRAF